MVAVVKNAAGGLYSDHSDPLLNWRVTIDNEASTNRNVFSNTSLAFERAARYHLNQGKQIHSLSGSKLRNTAVAIADGREVTGQVNPIFETLPLTERVKLVEIEVNTPTAGKTLAEIDLFKEVTRSV